MEIKDSQYVDGKGVHATKEYKKNRIIYLLSGKIYNYPTRETIHIGNNIHIYDKYGIFINHSFEPNIRIENNAIISNCDIKYGDELMFNYNDSEINMAAPFYVNNELVIGKQDRSICRYIHVHHLILGLLLLSFKICILDPMYRYYSQ